MQLFPVDAWPQDVERFSREKGCEILRVGHEHTDRDRFDVSFYRQLNMPFELRYSRFALPRVIPHEDELYDRLAPAAGGYCLVHREGTGGIYELTIASTLPVVYVDPRTNPFNNLLAYRKLIRDATEIHCINSSVIHLVDGIPTKAALFYHAVRANRFHAATVLDGDRVWHPSGATVVATRRRQVASAARATVLTGVGRESAYRQQPRKAGVDAPLGRKSGADDPLQLLAVVVQAILQRRVVGIPSRGSAPYLTRFRELSEPEVAVAERALRAGHQQRRSVAGHEAAAPPVRSATPLSVRLKIDRL